MALPPKYKIHPGIGIARLGDADAYFLGPEIPGGPAPADIGKPGPPYKEGGKIKPQAVRFRVFEYVDKGGEYAWSREINLDESDVDGLVWTVHIANRKASFFKFDGLAGFDRKTAGRRNNAKSTAVQKKFEIDPGPRTIGGKSKGPEEIDKKDPKKELWPSPAPVPEVKTLGRLATDATGNLLVIGGRGVTGSQPGAAPIINYANNDGWFDDVADGPVTVNLKFKGEAKAVAVEPAWVICAPPDFAPGLHSVVSLYDVLYDIAARELAIPPSDAEFSRGAFKGLAAIHTEFKKAGAPVLKKYQPDFNTEIYPILHRTVQSAFVFAPASVAHVTIHPNWKLLASNAAGDKAIRDAVFGMLRAPTTKPTALKPDMPKLLGDEPYDLTRKDAVPKQLYHQRVRVTLTPTQYALMKQWADGKFVGGTGIPAPPMGPFQITPAGLDRAALESCVGAAMYPGIEVSWLVRAASLFVAPFRIKHGAASPYLGDKPGIVRAGHLSRQMALPWQADFLMCRTEEVVAPDLFVGKWGWWPAQRPDNVYESAAEFARSPPNHVLWVRSTKGGVAQPWKPGQNQPDYVEMIANWKKFGFVVEDPKNPGIFIETDRAKDVP